MKNQEIKNFTLSVDFDKDERLRAVIAEHGFIAYGVAIKLMSEIYSNGYYIKWNERKAKILAWEMHVNIEYLQDVVKSLLTEGFFDHRMERVHGILTSSEIQAVYEKKKGRYPELQIIPEFLLLSKDAGEEEITKEEITKEEIAEKEKTEEEKKEEEELRIANEALLKQREEDNERILTIEEADERIANEGVIETVVDEIAKEEKTPEQHRLSLAGTGLLEIIDNIKNAKKSLNEERFNEFWEVYPRKTGKGEAEKSYKKIGPNQQLHEKIITALKKIKESAQWKAEGGRFIPLPATWLNQKRWEDEVPNVVHIPRNPSMIALEQAKAELLAKERTMDAEGVQYDA